MYRKSIVALTLGLAGLTAVVSGSGCASTPTEEQYDEYFKQMGDSLQGAQGICDGIYQRLE